MSQELPSHRLLGAKPNDLVVMEHLAKTRANRDGKAQGIWEHVGDYGRPGGDIPARHTFRVIDLSKPDPPDDWALVGTVDPDGV